MRKEIKVVPYNPRWKDTFNSEAKILKEALQQNCTQIYHIGSTSVTGLCAKPKIDIMCVVDSLTDAILPLENSGYKYRGEFNIPMRFFFSKRTPYSINLHILTSDNGELCWNLAFRDYLRENKKARDLYANTKINLINSNPYGFDVIPNMFSCYTSEKGKVVHQIVKEAGFQGERFVIATNPNEIDAYNSFIGSDDLNDNNNSNIFRLVLYKDMDIVAASCVKTMDDDLYNIKSVSGISGEFENRIIIKIQEWMKLHKKISV